MKANIFKITAIMLVLAVAVIGCDKSTETEVEMHKDVDSKINIRISNFSQYLQGLSMHFETTKMYSGFLNWLDVSWQKSSNVIDITFKDIIHHPRLSSATSWIDLGTLSNGIYQLNLRNGQVKYSGELIVTADDYTINFPTNPAFKFTNLSLNRIPKHTLWGTIFYRNEENVPLVQSFLTALMELGATKRSFIPGDYADFKIDDNGDIVHRYGNFTKSFIFYYSGCLDDLIEFWRKWNSEFECISMNIRGMDNETSATFICVDWDWYIP